MNLKRKVGPLPLWGWIAVAGGGLGMVYLLKRSKEKAPSAPEGQLPVPSAFAANPGEGGGVGGAGAGVASGEAKAPVEAPPVPLGTIGVQSPTYERGQFPAEVNDVREGAEALEGLGLVSRAGLSGSQAPATAIALQQAKGGNPREGRPFKTTTYKGHTAHEYAHAVPGGVGPGHRFVVLPIGKKTHAAKDNHAPAHAKDHHSMPAHKPAPHKPAPRKPAPRKPARHAAAPHRAKARR